MPTRVFTEVDYCDMMDFSEKLIAGKRAAGVTDLRIPCKEWPEWLRQRVERTLKYRKYNVLYHSNAFIYLNLKEEPANV